MVLFLFFVKYVAFPNRRDALLRTSENLTSSDVMVSSSGSMGFYYNDKCHQSFSNMTLNSNKNIDWCSNVAANENDKPWIQLSFKHHKKISGYSLRNGCCVHYYCCDIETNKVVDYNCCCRLYSFSLLGSNDNNKWEVIHSVKSNKEFYYCKTETFDFGKLTGPFKYIRLVQDQPLPSCQHCMVINQIELYGESAQIEDNDNTDSDETVSIIGKVRNS